MTNNHQLNTLVAGFFQQSHKWLESYIMNIWSFTYAGRDAGRGPGDVHPPRSPRPRTKGSSPPTGRRRKRRRRQNLHHQAGLLNPEGMRTTMMKMSPASTRRMDRRALRLWAPTLALLESVRIAGDREQQHLPGSASGGGSS